MGFFDNEDPSSSDQLDSQLNDLNNILMSTDVSPQARTMASGIKTDLRKVQSAGLDPSLTEPRQSFFSQLLDTLDAPRQGIAGVVDTALRGDMFTTDPNTGEDIGTGFERGQRENVTTSDILRRNDAIENPILRGVVGFAGDVLLDPLTYLTFGTGAAAKVGGRALTEAGAALVKTGAERLAQAVVTDTIEHSGQLDDIFKAIGRYQDSAKLIADTSSPAEKAIEAKKMSDAQDIFSSLFTPEEVASQKIFEKPGLHIGINLPFIGHITNPSEISPAEELLTEPGPVGQALRLAGKVFNPGRVSIADFQFDDKVLNAFDNIRYFANEKLSQIGDAIASTPIIGRPIAAAGNAVADTVDAANTVFKKIFYQSGLVGANAQSNRVDLLGVRAGNKIKAIDQVANIIGKENLANKDLLRDAYLTIDGLAMSSVQGAVKDDGLLDVINRIKSTGDVLEGDQLATREALSAVGADGATPEQSFRTGLAQYLAAPEVPQATKDLVQRVISGMDELGQTEAEKGLGYSFLEYYVPHRYKVLGETEAKNFPSAGKNEFFVKKRTYATVSDAFKDQGLVADTDLPSLLQYRFQKGYDAIANRQYAQRMMLEESLDPTLVKQLYMEALQNPGGDAERALARYRVSLQPVDTEALIEGKTNQLYQDAVGKLANGDPTAGAIVADGAAQMAQKVREEMFAAGAKPLDNQLPNSFLGELGRKIKLPGGDEAFFPKPIADSIEETLAARDILKDTLGQTAFGRATIGVLDHGTSFYKKWVTLPWPGYWGQNFLGDRFNQLMGGIHAIDPGIFARTKSVLAGESAITNRFGLRLDKGTLERLVKDMGINYSVNDFLGTTESFGKMNIDALLAQSNGIWKNLMSGAAGSKVAALKQTHDMFQKGFDGFFRLSQVVHRFEKGDSLADAVRNANQMYFNYRDVSPVEASLFRRFYMFYGYMSKATKQTVTNLMTSPGNLTMQLHGTDAMAEFFSDPKASPTMEEFDLKLLNSAVNAEQLSRAIGKNSSGQPIIARGFAAPLNAVMQQFSLEAPRNYSVGEIVNAAGDSIRRTVQKQFAMANPAINAAAQLISGKNLYFDRPLDSDFLRKLPDLTEAAKTLAGYAHTDIPITINDTVKKFLNATPDGKGRLIADPAKMWILTNIIPGMGRAVSTAGTFANADIPTPQSLLRFGTGINVSDQDVSRSYLATRRDELDQFMRANSVNQRLKNIRQDEIDATDASDE